ncbi:SAM-dependent methyltransferase, partial [Streptomyces pilosus]
MADAAPRLKDALEQLIGTTLPVRVRTWDGSQAGPPDAPPLVVRNRRAVRHLLRKPGELGLARAWVAGDVTVEGDLYTVLDRLAGHIWERGEDDHRTLTRALRDPAFRSAVRGLLALAGPPLPPAPPPEEARRPRRGLH